MMETIAGRYEPVSFSSNQDREDLHSEGYTSFDEMDGLSDSQSTFASHSRPITPSDHTNSQHLVTVKPNSRSRSFSAESENPDLPHFAVPTKAIHILGLVPGTLPYAQACLENARDEARRLSDIAPHASNPPGSYTEVGGSGPSEVKKGGGRMDRARKALSIHMPSTGSTTKMIYNQGNVPSVIMSLEGEEEEMKRERRRKVADGVLHWQKEVQRLREIEETSQAGAGTMGRKGSKKGRRS